VIVRNENGEPVLEDGEKEARKQFAREQIAYLVNLGFSQGSAYRIMKAAGPGQVKAAVEWAYKARTILASRYERHNSWGEPEENERLAAAVDALDVVLSGSGGTNGFGFGRMASALRALGLPVPSCSTARVFFGVLAGAKAILLAGLPRPKESKESTEATA